MGRPAKDTVKTTRRPKSTRAALTPEAQEDKLISLAVDLVEQRLLQGTATSQETTTILKLASRKHRLELEMLEEQVKLTKAKTEQIKAMKNMDELVKDAIKAMKTYQGLDDEEEEGEFDDDY